MKGTGTHTLLPRAAAAFALKAEQQASSYEGQQAGIPGMGPAPDLLHLPGGQLVTGLQHPSFTTTERLSRKMPQAAWFDPNLGPSRPIQFEVVTFSVPNGSDFWLFDYELAAYRPSGIDPGDFIKAADGRFGNQIGGDLLIGRSSRPGDISYQLDPVPPTVGSAQFEPAIGSPRGALTTKFNSAAANNFSPATSAGTSLLPLRRAVQGPENSPFTVVVDGGSSVTMRCAIFNTLTSPIAAIEGRLAGYLINTFVSGALVNRVRPR